MIRALLLHLHAWLTRILEQPMLPEESPAEAPEEPQADLAPEDVPEPPVRLPERPGQYFAWSEFEVTRTGIANVAPREARERILVLVRDVLDPLRKAIGRPVRITSGYRNTEVNARVGGSPRSDHLTGGAADFKASGLTAEDLAHRVVELGLPFDQLIVYPPERGGHTHVGIRPEGNRRQILRAKVGGGFERWNP